MNILYGLLVDDQQPSGWYAKKYTPTFQTPTSKALQRLIMSNMTADRIPMLACIICHEVLSTCFGAEILELDPNNTYNKPSRAPGTAPNDPKALAHDLLGSAQDHKAFNQYLDADIKARLVAPTWGDMLAAACLQMLREVN